MSPTRAPPSFASDRLRRGAAAAATLLVSFSAGFLDSAVTASARPTRTAVALAAAGGFAPGVASAGPGAPRPGAPGASRSPEASVRLAPVPGAAPDPPAPDDCCAAGPPPESPLWKAVRAAASTPLPAALEVATAPPRRPGSPGFHPAVITRTVRAALDLPGRARRTARLRAGTRVELLSPPPFLEGRPWCLLGDGRVAWVPADHLEAVPERELAAASDLARLPGARVGEAPFGDTAGVRYRRVSWRGARLHLVDIDLAANPALRPGVAASDFFGKGRGAGFRREPVWKYARRVGAVVAINGTYFSTGSGNYGAPLGALIHDGEVLNHKEEPAAFLRRRSYLAWTDRGRFFTGELDEPGADLLARSRRGEFRPGDLAPGERLVGLMGGLGRLVAGGDPEAWRRIFRSQFPARFYSRKNRRSQVLLGVGENRRHLMLLLQEDKPYAKTRLTLPELGHILRGRGAREVVFGDGGGSVDMVVFDRHAMRGQDKGRRRPVSSVFFVRESGAEG